MSRRRAEVRIDGRLCGELVETESGSRFRYEPAYLVRPGAVPVSLTLPLRDAPYDAAGLHPFFENLLPEGWLLDIATAKLKVQRDDAFGILLATCCDCMGAVEIVPRESEGEP